MGTIKDTNYAIPSGARFVATNGNDNNSGTQSAPWRTLIYAINKATSGSTIVIRGGIYRTDRVNLNKKLTLQPYPHEDVWLKGSLVVDDWVADGSKWRRDNWTYKFTPSDDPGESIDPEAKYLEQVFLDNVPLAQVLSESQVGPGKFYLDRTNDKLYIGSNPSGKTVEATAFARGIQTYSLGGGAQVKGIGILHYAEIGILIAEENCLIENNLFEGNAAIGLAVTGDDCKVRGNVFSSNGQAGMSGAGMHRGVVEGNIFSKNNSENFAKNYAAAGAKITRTDSIVVRNNIFGDNNSMGLWLDLSCTNSIIVRNIVRHNEVDGIFFEASHKAIIASNLVHNNGEHGINIHNSTSAKVYNNTLAKNAINIGIGDTPRKNTDSEQFAAGITWETANNVVKNNILSSTEGTSSSGWGSCLLLVFTQVDLNGRRLVTGIDHNGYYRTSSSSPEFAIRYRTTPDYDPKVKSVFRTVEEFRGYTPFEDHYLAVDNATNPFFVNEAEKDYRLKSGSPANNRGEPLPSDVASAIGARAGVKVDMGALHL